MKAVEQWKPIVGYEGKYEVSNLGNIKSVNYGIMKLHKNNSGYLLVGLRDGNGKVRHLVHRLVAKAFIPNPSRWPHINHKNENKIDNRADNLEWCNPKYNNNYGNARAKSSAAHINHPDLSMPVLMLSKGGAVIKEYPSAHEAARMTGIDLSNIVRCCNGVKYYNTAGGYKWKYKND